MAINPQIPLMVQAPDIGGAITRGLQGAQSLLAMRQSIEERERQKRLAPYEEQLAKLKLEAAPIELVSIVSDLNHVVTGLLFISAMFLADALRRIKKSLTTNPHLI